MADTITTSKYLGITINNEANNPDAKNQTIKLYNPMTNVTETQIKNAMNKAFEKNLFLDTTNSEGDPVPYTTDSSIVTAYTEDQQIEKLDIGVE